MCRDSNSESASHKPARAQPRTHSQGKRPRGSLSFARFCAAVPSLDHTALPVCCFQRHGSTPSTLLLALGLILLPEPSSGGQAEISEYKSPFWGGIVCSQPQYCLLGLNKAPPGTDTTTGHHYSEGTMNKLTNFLPEEEARSLKNF